LTSGLILAIFAAKDLMFRWVLAACGNLGDAPEGAGAMLMEALSKTCDNTLARTLLVGARSEQRLGWL
jgi:hypothetical protein